MTEHKPAGFWDRAVRNFRSAWDKIASDKNISSKIIVSSNLEDDDRLQLIDHMQACLDATGGEVSARKRAAELGHAYLSLTEIGRKKFLTILATEFSTNRQLINEAIRNLSQSEGADNLFLAEQKLRNVLKAPRINLLTQFNALPEGVKFLVDMRKELIPWAKKDMTLKGLETDLKALLSSWFDVGFLELKQITWNAPASLLEKLIAYEAVHEIKDWEDLKNRLASDRRCFAYFHPRMPNEPLIFVWVALVEGIADNVHVLLDPDAPLGDPETVNSAIFYSISNAQAGLTGINFGNFLIKRVVDSLSRELSNIQYFATLSPIPGFNRWLDQCLLDEHFDFLTPEQVDELMATADKSSPAAALKELLSRDNWYFDSALSDILKAPLLRLCTHYLLFEKRTNHTAADSVAHFHLNNGARLEQLNWLADLSARGLKQSNGIMLNYLYDLKTIDANHESYRAGEPVITSAAVKNLL
jgi:malonyl-CoA decarboxylase